MTAKTRIYKVDRKDGKAEPRLIRATSRSAAIRHVATEYQAEVCNQDDLVAMLGQSKRVEDAAADEPGV